MFLEILLAILLGVLAGCFTGLIPGIHTNLIAASLAMISFENTTFLVVFIIAMSITHSFTNVIPSIFLGAPEPSTALNILPGHKMLMEGLGLNAIKLTLVGSMLGLLVCFLLYPILKVVISITYEFLSKNIALLLLLIGIFLITRTKDIKSNAFIYLTAGIIGILVLNSKMENPLFAMLSGFFGVSTLIFSLQNKSIIPKQKVINFNYNPNKLSLALGTFSGFLTSILPGLGSSTAAAISSSIKKETETNDFLFMMGSISTVNFFMSIAALSVIEKARNGSIVAIMSITNQYNIALMIAASLISAGLALYSTIRISKIFQKIIVKVNYTYVVYIVILIIFIMSVLLSGISGLVVLFTCTALGLYSNVKGTPRNLMMASIMVPVSLFFIF